MKILFVHNHLSHFVQIDLQLLQQQWDVHEWYEQSPPINVLAVAHAVRQSDLIIGWFASWHTFWPFTLARLMGKPSLIIIGGYDVANMPEIGYGHQRGGVKKWISRWIVHIASRCITFSNYSQKEIERNLGLTSSQIPLIYLGVPDPFATIDNRARENLALTVGAVDHSNLLRKGHEAFVQAAASLPEMTFALVGLWCDDAAHLLRSMATPNVVLTDWLEPRELNSYFMKAAVYVQASQHEAFGLSVAEAMLAGCIPVVTQSGSLPEVVGECGVYIPSSSPGDIVTGIEEASSLPKAARFEARERILNRFSIEQRKQSLAQVINSLVEQVP